MWWIKRNLSQYYILSSIFEMVLRKSTDHHYKTLGQYVRKDDTLTIKNIITSICATRDTVMCCVQIERKGLFDVIVPEGSLASVLSSL